jgi:hypothetical protein
MPVEGLQAICRHTLLCSCRKQAITLIDLGNTF